MFCTTIIMSNLWWLYITLCSLKQFSRYLYSSDWVLQSSFLSYTRTCNLHVSIHISFLVSSLLCSALLSRFTCGHIWYTMTTTTITTTTMTTMTTSSSSTTTTTTTTIKPLKNAWCGTFQALRLIACTMVQRYQASNMGHLSVSGLKSDQSDYLKFIGICIVSSPDLIWCVHHFFPSPCPIIYTWLHTWNWNSNITKSRLKIYMCWLDQILSTRVQLEVGSLRPAGRGGLAAPGAQTVTSYPVLKYGQQAHRNLTGETKCFNLIGAYLPTFLAPLSHNLNYYI